MLTGRLAESVSDFDVPMVNQKFNILLALANIFVVKASNLPLVLQEGAIAQVAAALKYKYVMCRSDWETAGIQQLLADSNIHPPV